MIQIGNQQVVTNINVVLHGKTAVKIKATKIGNSKSGLSSLYDCEGDNVWIPNSVCWYDSFVDTLVIEEWWFNKAVNEGKL